MSQLLNYGKVGTLTKEKEILNAWTPTGLLEGLKPKMKKLVSLALERGAKSLLTEKYGNNWKGETIAFPIIRRIMTNIDNKNDFYKLSSKEIRIKKDYILEHIDVDDIMNKINKTYDNLENSITLMNDVKENEEMIVDIEAETAALFADLMSDIICRKYHRTDMLKLKNGKVLLFDRPKRNHGR